MSDERSDGADEMSDLTLGKREFLKATGTTAAAATGLNLGVGVQAAGADHTPWDEEPMNTQVKTIDDSTVLFQYGQPVPSLDTWHLDEPARDYVDLDGTWKFTFGNDGKDPEQVGMNEGWYESDYDDSDWEDREVPLPWDLYDTPWFGQERLNGDPYDEEKWGQGTDTRDGYGWYRKTVSLGEQWAGKAVRLNFLSAYYRARVWVNGTEIGIHEGGNDPFSLDISDALEPGTENVIAVRVYRRPWHSTYDDDANPESITSNEELPPGVIDFWPYAGLVRSVYIEGTDTLAVSKLLTDASEGSLSVDVVLYNYASEQASRTLTVDPGEGTGGSAQTREVTVDGESTRVVSMTVDIPDADQWDALDPATYEVSAELSDGQSVTDRLTTTYGMRTITVEDGHIKLNGEDVFLKGLNWIEENHTHGRSMTQSEMDSQFQNILDMNCNFMRQQEHRHPYSYEWADENGVLVMDGAPNIWMSAEAQDLQLDYGLSEALTRTMAWHKHNHPSTVFWSLHNEMDTAAPYVEFTKQIREAALELDRQNRLITWASQNTTEEAHEYADVRGFNEYYGYFGGNSAGLSGGLERMHEEMPDVPVVIVENGKHSGPGFRDQEMSPTHPHSESSQAAYFQAHWNQVSQEQFREYLHGYTHWVLQDYKTRAGYNWGRPNGISPMGTTWFEGDQRNQNFFRIKNAPNPLTESAPSYSIDEGDGSTVSDTSDTGADATVDGATWETDETVPDDETTVLSFDGEASLEADGAPIARKGGYSQLMWVFLDNTDEDQVLAGDWGQANSHRLAYKAGTDTLQLRIEDTRGNTLFASNPDSSPPVGEWFQVGWTYDGSVYHGGGAEWGKLRLYQNGSIVAESETDAFPISETDSRLYGNDYSDTAGWSGAIASIDEWYHLKPPSFFSRNFEETTNIISIDNEDEHTTLEGPWVPGQQGTQGELYHGEFYLTDSDSNKGGNVVTFVPEVLSSTTYAVYAWVITGPTNARNVPVTVTHADGSETITVNQRRRGSRLLGPARRVRVH